MKRFVLLLTSSLIWGVQVAAEPLHLQINADSAILMNAETGAILYEKNARARHYPASITKIATALFLLEERGAQLDDEITISQEAVAAISTAAKRKANYRLPSHWLEFGSSHIGLKKGEQVSLRTLLYGLMLASGNDAANAIAEAVEGSIPAFVERMNRRCAELGCEETHFMNPSGLHHPEHRTSAYDMALITREALRHPLFREVTSSRSYRKPASNKQGATTFVQKNRLLKPGDYYYPHALGVKTGYTEDAGATFVGAATDGERTLIAVVLRCTESGQIFKETKALFEAAFAQELVERPLVRSGEQSYQRQLQGASRPVKTYVDEGVAMTFYPAEEPELQGELAWDSLELPIKKGQRVGEIRVYDAQGEVLSAVPLLAQEGVKATLPYRIQRWVGDLRFWGRGAKILIVAGTLLVLILLFRQRKRSS